MAVQLSVTLRRLFLSFNISSMRTGGSDTDGIYGKSKSPDSDFCVSTCDYVTKSINITAISQLITKIKTQIASPYCKR